VKSDLLPAIVCHIPFDAPSDGKVLTTVVTPGRKYGKIYAVISKDRAEVKSLRFGTHLARRSTQDNDFQVFHHVKLPV
jgi:hypothetical protein